MHPNSTRTAGSQTESGPTCRHGLAGDATQVRHGTPDRGGSARRRRPDLPAGAGGAERQCRTRRLRPWVPVAATTMKARRRARASLPGMTLRRSWAAHEVRGLQKLAASRLRETQGRDEVGPVRRSRRGARRGGVRGWPADEHAFRGRLFPAGQALNLARQEGFTEVSPRRRGSMRAPGAGRRQPRRVSRESGRWRLTASGLAADSNRIRWRTRRGGTFRAGPLPLVVRRLGAGSGKRRTTSSRSSSRLHPDDEFFSRVRKSYRGNMRWHGCPG